MMRKDMRTPTGAGRGSHFTVSHAVLADFPHTGHRHHVDPSVQKDIGIHVHFPYKQAPSRKAAFQTQASARPHANKKIAKCGSQ